MIVDELHSVLEARKEWATARARMLALAMDADTMTCHACFNSARRRAEAEAGEAELAYERALETFWLGVERIAEGEAKYVARQGAE